MKNTTATMYMYVAIELYQRSGLDPANNRVYMYLGHGEFKTVLLHRLQYNAQYSSHDIIHNQNSFALMQPPSLVCPHQSVLQGSDIQCTCVVQPSICLGLGEECVFFVNPPHSP